MGICYEVEHLGHVQLVVCPHFCHCLTGILPVTLACLSGGQSIQQGSGDSSHTQMHPPKNTALLCKVGCETVQEVVMRTCEVFTHLKNVQVSQFIIFLLKLIALPPRCSS